MLELFNAKEKGSEGRAGLFHCGEARFMFPGGQFTGVRS